jgi:acyl transferase domain-containing protein
VSPARGATGKPLVGLDLEHQHAVVAGGYVEDMDPLDTEQFIGPRTATHRDPQVQ